MCSSKYMPSFTQVSENQQEVIGKLVFRHPSFGKRGNKVFPKAGSRVQRTSGRVAALKVIRGAAKCRCLCSSCAL